MRRTRSQGLAEARAPPAAQPHARPLLWGLQVPRPLPAPSAGLGNPRPEPSHRNKVQINPSEKGDTGRERGERWGGVTRGQIGVGWGRPQWEGSWGLLVGCTAGRHWRGERCQGAQRALLGAHGGSRLALQGAQQGRGWALLAGTGGLGRCCWWVQGAGIAGWQQRQRAGGEGLHWGVGVAAGTAGLHGGAVVLGSTGERAVLWALGGGRWCYVLQGGGRCWVVQGSGGCGCWIALGCRQCGTRRELLVGRGAVIARRCCTPERRNNSPSSCIPIDRLARMAGVRGSPPTNTKGPRCGGREDSP